MDGTILNKKYNLEERVKALEEGGGGGGYVLPVASANTLGGVKIGNNLTIGEDGTLSAPAPTPPYIPPAYSTSEYDTGKKWIDNKTIYGKVFTFQSDLSVSNSSWTNTSEVINNIGILISAQGVYDDACYPLMGAFDSSGILSLMACRASTSVDVKSVIVEYTKIGVTKKKK